MNRLDRLTSILIQLQSKRLTTAREIAKRFEVTNRTIYRDIQTLRLAGVPIAFCELGQEIREFRLDRIKELELQQTHFKPDKSFSIEQYLEERSNRLF
jgi:predicted DNA-binding transcriptional regulator YafY